MGPRYNCFWGWFEPSTGKFGRSAPESSSLVGRSASGNNIPINSPIKEDIVAVALKNGVFESEEEYFKALRKCAIKYSSEKLEGVKYDKIIVELSRLLTEVERAANVFTERYVSFKAALGSVYEYRENKNNLQSETLKSLPINSLKMTLEHLKRLRNHTEKEIETLVKNLMPNTHALLGGILAAQMLSLAGTFERFAGMTSSTVQMLGAEKALFRYMRGEGGAPKHGILFTHPLVRKLPKRKRGRMARFIANKVAIAVKVDYYRGEFIGEKLKGEVEKNYKKLRAKKE